jgi:DNA repair exonuclease SbcCD ATPase subunit
MDVFRVDFLTFKEVQVGKIDNIDVIFKKVANESFTKVREVEAQMGLIKDEFVKLSNEQIREVANLYEKLGAIQNEIIEIKNEKKALTNLRSKVHWASDASQKVEALVEETNTLYNMIQRFIDEHGTARIKTLSTSEGVTMKDKMNVMDWLARNADFLS